MANKKGGKKEKPVGEKKDATEPGCCAVAVVMMDGKGKTVLPLKIEDGDIKVGDKTLKIRCECD